MFRVLDNDNYYRFSMDPVFPYRRLVKKVDGVYTVLWEDDVVYSPLHEFLLEASVVGSEISVSLDGETLFTVTDDSIYRGSVALYSAHAHDPSRLHRIVLLRIVRM